MYQNKEYTNYTREQVLQLLDMIPLQKRQDKGNNVVVCCLYHDDNNPSMSIDINNNGIFKCWSCGAKGNIVTLCMDFLGDHPNKILGLDEDKDFSKKGSSKHYDFTFRKTLQSNREEALFKEMNRLKQKEVTIKIQGNLYNINLLKPATLPVELILYLEKRRIYQEFINKFQLKWCKVIEVNKKFYINRLIIPIVENNKLISLEGRDYTEKQDKKIIYGKETTVNTLFNIDNLDFNKPIIMTEGIMELPTLDMLGYSNYTCLFGATITNRQKDIIKNKIKKLVYIPNNPKLENEIASREVMKTLHEIKGDDVRFKILPGHYKDLDSTPLDIVKNMLSKQSISYQDYSSGKYINYIKDKFKVDLF